MQKGGISKRVFQGNKAGQNFRQRMLLTPSYAHVRVGIRR